MSAPIDREQALFWKPLPDGVHEVIVYPIFGGAQVSYGRLDSQTIDSTYHYSSRTLAIVAAQLWNGEGDPIDGWFRHVHSGRRREHGDPQKETVRR